MGELTVFSIARPKGLVRGNVEGWGELASRTRQTERHSDCSMKSLILERNITIFAGYEKRKNEVLLEIIDLKAAEVIVERVILVEIIGNYL